jgi:chromatin assembly factor 1 subunit B
MQVYDLAWSPNGDFILAGSTDNIARIFSTIDGRNVYHIAIQASLMVLFI